MKIRTIVAGVVAAFAAVALAARFVWGLIVKRAEEKQTEGDAEAAKEATRERIENTPAGDLLAASPDRDRHSADLAGIKADFGERLRDRARQVVSGTDGDSAP